MNAGGQLLVTTPVLRWQNFIGLLAASYTVAAKLGIPRWAVDAGAGVLAVAFIVKVAYVSATTLTDAKDRL